MGTPYIYIYIYDISSLRVNNIRLGELRNEELSNLYCYSCGNMGQVLGRGESLNPYPANVKNMVSS